MKKYLIITIFLFFCGSVFSQVKLIGTITDNNGKEVVGANIYIKGTYDGTTSDSTGKFILRTSAKGKQIIKISFIGYKDYEREISINNNEQNFSFKLEEDIFKMPGVQIVAGSFKAGDKIKSIALQPMDIVTTASTAGDIYGALSALPGASKVGESGMLYVRGGDASESQTYIDNIKVESPYLHRLSNVPTRGRYSPLLFNGTLFSTGGYSAEFGQALSSVLLLTTNNMPADSKTDISLYSTGVGVAHTHLFNNSAIVATFDYSNFKPYYELVKQRYNWIKPPETIYATVGYTVNFKNGGRLKTLLSINYDDFKFLTQNGYILQDSQAVRLTNKNVFLKSNYYGKLSENSTYDIGIGFNLDENTFGFSKSATINDKVINPEFKLTFNTILSKKVKLRYGGNLFFRSFAESIDSLSNQQKLDFGNQTIAAFAETELNFGNSFAMRLGGRIEHNSITTPNTFGPRISMAYKFKESGQFSFAYGIFYQSPADMYLKFTTNLKQEVAHHYILNYQFEKNKRLFRLEIYYKNYNSLVKFPVPYLSIIDLTVLDQFNWLQTNYNNSGKGYAKGLDLFFRDKKTIENGDFWISYSFLDTKRDYKYFYNMATPSSFARHNFSFVYKQWITSLHSNIGLTYSFASGRPYFNPNLGVTQFLSQHTKPYNDLSLNYAFDLSSFTKAPITLFFMASNVLGFKNIFGYRPTTYPDANGQYILQPIEPQSTRFFLVALFLTFKNENIK